ncbi:MAG: glucose-1-phosphate adenylyltransferase, partial [Clostridiaceae bacterium]|nr:glucose-1-phosphate adenylyltransferase [Clostridiaceae bacterium]
SRYGIMNTDESSRIFEFEEKPKNPKNNLASMGVYIFTWNALKEYLIRDDQNNDSDHDFGKNIIPMMLNEGKSMWAYKFNGYWRDVGTIQAYWESNMDLISRVPDLNLFDPAWKIYTPNPVKPPHYIGPEGSIKKAIVSEGCMIYGSVKNSVIFPGVYIGKGTVIEDSIIMSDTSIGEDCSINQCIIGEGSRVGNNVKMGIGEMVPNEIKPSLYNSGITVVGELAVVPDESEIGKNVVIDINTTLEDYCSLKIESGKSILKGGECE